MRSIDGLVAQMRRRRIRAHRFYNRLRHGVPDRYARLLDLADEVHPERVLEIGVCTGHHARALIERAARYGPVTYFGFDLFEEASSARIAAELGKTPPSRELVARHLAEVLPRERIHLVAGDTRETLPAALAALPPMDLVFLDGGHSYETVASDWACVRRLLRPGSVAVFDDSVNEAAIEAEGWGTNRVVDAIDRRRFDVTRLDPVDWWEKPWGILKSRLVAVRPR